MANILILGAGSMGTAFSFPCSDNGHSVSIVGTHLEDDLIENIKSNNQIHPALKTQLPKEIKFENVSFQYENSDQYSLRNINVDIPRGSTLALVGSSGAGKSTFADLVPRFYDVSNGCIYIDGVDIREIEIEKLRSLMGIVSQDTILFNDTVSNNICYGKPDTDIEKIRLAADAAHSMEFIENH